MILPARTAVISPRNSEPQINPCFVTKQNSAHRHHCRVAATLPAKNIRLTCTQKMLLFFFCMALHSFTRCAVLCGAATTTVHPSLCFSLSPSVSVAQVADGVAYRRFHVGKVKRPCALTHSLTHSLRCVKSVPPLSPFHLLTPSSSNRAGAERDARTRGRRRKRQRERPPPPDQHSHCSGHPSGTDSLLPLLLLPPPPRPRPAAAASAGMPKCPGR